MYAIKRSTFTFLFLLSILLTGCIESAADSPYPPITFEKKASFPGKGLASAISFVINEKAYVAFGRNFETTCSNECWQYDPIEDKWTKNKDIPLTARVKAIAAVVNGKAYVGLGFNLEKADGVRNDPGILKDFWMYDPVLDSWTQKADFPTNATDGCVSFVINNDIYICGGFHGEGFTRDSWKYNTLTNQWEKTVNLPGRFRAVAVCCCDSLHIFYGTGFHDADSKNDWWEFSPQNKTWTEKKTMPDNGRANAVALSINNRYFVSTGRHFGGELTGGHVKSDILEFDASRNVWYKRGNMPTSGRENAIAFTIKGKGYVGLGENDTNAMNDLWSFEP